jgi:hypothetical protein
MYLVVLGGSGGMQILLSSDEKFIFGNCDSQLGINVIDENARLSWI